MLKDYEYERLVKSLTDIYSEIETELLINIARRFDTYSTVGGTLKWHIDKLDDLGALNKESIKIIAKYSKKTEQAIISMMNEAGYSVVDMSTLKKAYDISAIKIDPSILYNSNSIKNVIDLAIKDSKTIMNIINTKAIESTRQAYMKILNQTYLEVSGGIYDYNTSIKKALMKMADEGIAGATYKQEDGSIRKYSLEGTVRRDIITKTRQVANECSIKSIEELGINTVYVSQHLGARTGEGINDHAGWQGKVYMIVGSNEEYANLYVVTGYGELLGLGGVNCRHFILIYIEGVTKIPERIDVEENERVYKLTQEQRRLERKVREQKKKVAVVETTDDSVLLGKERKKLLAYNKDLKRYMDSHSELKYKQARTYVVPTSK